MSDKGSIDPQTAPPFAALELLDDLFEGVLIYGPDGRFVYANPAALRLLDATRAQLLASTARRPPKQLLDVLGGALPPQQWPPLQILQGAKRLPGRVVGVADSASCAPRWLLISAYARSVQGQRYAMMNLVDARAPLGFSFRDLVENSEDAVLVTDAELGAGGPHIQYANPAFEALSGYPVHTLLGRSPSFLQGRETDRTVCAEIRRALEAGQPVRRELLNFNRSGQPYWVEIQIAPVRHVDGELTHFVGTQREVTHAHRVIERLQHEASHDALTGLLNRRGFAEQAELLLAQARRLEVPVGLLMLDIDHFKQVNDSEGHEAGDRLLKFFADSLRQRLGEADVVARLGGDEFVVLLALGTEPHADELAEALRQGAIEAFRSHGAPQATGVSIGLCVDSAETPLPLLLARADHALFAAKHAGRDRVESDSR